MALLFILLILLSLPFTTAAQPACTRWASPSGTGTGASVGSPYQISNFLALGNTGMRGQVLCLLNGTYPALDLAGVDGTSSQRITIRALNDGGALFRGDYALSVTGTYLHIEGVNVEGTNGEWALGIRGQNNILRRIVAWGAVSATQDDIRPIDVGGVNNLLEDCAAFGTGRKTLGMLFQGALENHDNTIRRCWVRYERRPFCDPQGQGCSPATGVEIGYGNTSNTLENLLATWNLTNPIDEGNWSAPLYVSRNSNNTVYGALVYIPQQSDWFGGTLAASESNATTTGNEVRDLVAIVHPNNATASTTQPFALEACQGGPCVATNVLGVGGAISTSAWTNTNVHHYASRASAEAAQGGSLWTALPGLCYQVINKTITTQPLWPWPMRQRIMDATQYVWGVVTDVHTDVQSVLGSLPAACLTGQQQPVATSLRFDTQPTETPVDTPMAQAVVVKVDDQFGQEFDTFTGTITLTFTLGTDTEGATMSGPGCSGAGSASTCSVQAVQGDATFTSLQFSEPSVDGYRLRATATLNGQVTTVDSVIFAVTQPDTAPAQLVWLLAPASALVNAVLTPTPQAQVQTSTGDPYTAGPIPLTIRALPAAQRLSVSGRHFVDPQGRAVLLTGSHTWENLIDFSTNPNAPYDWLATMHRMELGWDAGVLGAYQPRQNHVRLWVWEGLSAASAALPPYIFVNDGPGGDWDFSTTGCKNPLLVSDPIRLNQTYFDRLATRVGQARERGIYVTVMLFQGWDMDNHGYVPNSWYAAASNCNGVDGYDQASPPGVEIAQGIDPVIQHIQEEYVKKIVDTLYDYDNVLWEVGNEIDPSSLSWQEDWVTFLKAYETTKGGIRHLIGISSLAGTGGALETTNADWIAPGALNNSNPAVAATTKPSMWDTDHMGTIDRSTPFTLWAAFLRGHHPIYMDGHPEPIWADPTENNQRQAMAQIWALAQRVNLLTMTPQNGGTTPANTGYALVNSTSAPYQYLVFQPNATGSVTLTGIPAGTYTRQWLNLSTGALTTQGNVTNPASPVTYTITGSSAYGWVLLLRQTTSPAELVLAGTTTHNTSGGSASFPGLTLPRTGVAHLVTTSPGLTTSTSAAFAVTADTPAATALAYTQGPTTVAINTTMSPAVTVQLLDQAGLPFADADVPITLTKASGPGTLSGGGPVNTDANGLATFPAVQLDTAGTVTITASSAGLTSVTSGNVVISAAPAVATKLAFRQQPLSTYLDTVLMPAVTVEIQDANDQFMPTGSATVAVALTTPAGAVLSGDTSNPTSSGVATFPDLQVNKPGTYTLTATGGGLTQAVSSSFTITAAPPPTYTLHWAMGEGSGTVLNDTGMTGLHDGTFGAGATAPAWVTGPLGGTTALAFTAAQQDVVTNSTITCNIKNPVTVVAWVRTVGAVGANQGLFVGGTDSEESFTIGARLRNTNNQLVWMYGQTMVGGQLTWTWSANLLGTWTRIALVGGGTQEQAQRIYVNGMRVASNTYAVTTVDQGNRTGLRLGKHNVTGNVNEWCNCEVADVQVHAVAWQDADAQADANVTPPPAGFTGTPWSMFFGRP